MQLESPECVETNEAYACVIKQNKAYETSIIGKLNPVQTIGLKPNEAYESVVNNPAAIYEEIV